MLIQEIPIRRLGKADALRVVEREVEEALGAHDVAVAVKYSGINFADIMMRIGHYPDAPPKPFVPGYEISGVIEAVGAEVDRFRVGDQVMAGTYFGGYRSRVTIADHQIAKIPAGMDLQQGAALPVAFITVQGALFEMARVRQGDRVLVESATGGVGTLAIQMARRAGAEVLGLTTTASKKPYIESLGATALTLDEMRRDSSQRDFDVVLNSTGGGSVKWQMQRLAMTGRMVCIGMSSATRDGRRSLARLLWAGINTPWVPVVTLFNQNRGVYGFNALKLLQDPGWVSRLTGKLAAPEVSQLEPHIGEVFPAVEVGAAHRFLETKQATGKLLLAW